MQNYNSIIGLPVVINNNSKIAVVQDILYCGHSKTILGLIISSNEITSTYKYIPLDEIECIKNTSIKVKSTDSIKQINRKDKLLYKSVTDTNKCKINTAVITEDKHKIGRIKDINFNFEAGVIDSYIISDGIVDDLLNGRTLIDDSQTVHKKNKLFVKNINKKS